MGQKEDFHSSRFSRSIRVKIPGKTTVQTRSVTRIQESTILVQAVYGALAFHGSVAGSYR